MEGVYAAQTGGEGALAQGLGLVAWTGDPQAILQNGVDSTGTIHGAAVWLPAGKTISKISELVAVAGAAVTHGVYGLFDSNFNLLAKSADTPAAFQAAGWVELALTTPYVIPVSGFYYVAARSKLPNGVWRYFNQAGPLAAFPSPLVPAVSGIARCFLLR